MFLITNGRSSFPYALAHLESQEGVEFDLYVIRDLPHSKAYRACLKEGEAPFYLRVDDDMFLHPHAVAYFNHLATNLGRKTVMAYARLWEFGGWDWFPCGCSREGGQSLQVHRLKERPCV